ncbi:MAG: M48 family metalloprotease [Kiritimatiellae bacterium]|nr:M48 family metalloprotease [Kiritimatiellia bacterium]MDD5522286.1 M48 family metalloprotease [Kiritimatiellia bacterium]
MSDNFNGICISRRNFLVASAGATTAALTGCATNPVTGRSQLMLMSEASELNMDQRWAPHQFSSDYGATQDRELNDYISKVGNDIARYSHRIQMPYNFRVLNTTVVNGYTFPAGSVGLARGLMIMMEDESQLAGVLGHEIGHVNYRHAGERMTKQLAWMGTVALVGAYLEYEKKKYAALAAGLGAIGANMLLCRYSRENEREADEIGMEYMVRAGHNPKGMVGLMDGFRKLSKSKPNVVELLFASHPMSDERYNTAVARIKQKYSDKDGLPLNKERYMDNTARLRAIRGAIEKMQEGETCLMKNKPAEAEGKYREALRLAPNDYAGLLMMSKCLLVQKKYRDAENFAEAAKSVYPEEPQAKHVSGMAKVANREFDAALNDFNSYEQVLPGNTNTIYLKGLCYDRMGNKRQAAGEYQKYLNQDPNGEHADEVKTRLITWGYLAEQKKAS